ncbi:MAG: hypothetical protein ACFCVE_10415 [Phycisphaerae bacterium]
MRNTTSIAIALAAATTLACGGTLVAQNADLDKSTQPDRQVQQVEDRQQALQRQQMQQQDRQQVPRAPRGDQAMDQRQLDAVLGVFQAQPDAIRPVAIDDKHDILEIISETTEAAVTEDGFDDVVERLNDQDRNRLGEVAGGWFTPEEQEALNAASKSFREAWEAKYGGEFEMEDIDAIYENGLIARAEIVNPTSLLNNWPVPVTQQAGAREAAGVGGMAEGEDLDDAIEDANLGEGRDLAVVQLDAMGQFPELRISFLYEFPGVWKIDIPNDVDGNTAVRNLTETLTQLAANPASWPEDEQRAYALVSRAVIAALYDADVNLGQ